MSCERRLEERGFDAGVDEREAVADAECWWNDGVG